jgi:serine/threonine protein kinase
MSVTLFAEKLSNLRMGPLEGLLNSESEQKGCFPLLPLRLMEDTWYTSPEEVQDGTCSYASDIYSLGVLFFEVLIF